MKIMEITYIGHSGFLIEWETCYWLFDYYKGDIPEMASGKKIFVFASHKHQDHFNPDIFHLFEKYPDIQYVLSSDIKLLIKGLPKPGITSGILDKTLSVKPSGKYELYGKNDQIITLETLKSTDCGVAFLLHYEGKTVYHAGDLNLWVWKGESKQYNNHMKALFQEEMNCLKNLPIDIAFAPLDPRLEENYYLGLESLLETAKVKYVFPMHFWEKPSIIEQFKKERTGHVLTEIMDISRDGQQWKIE
jgi:L-ascorbate metabolism protein UlaG (beta-lactamase superfamily)